MWGTQETNAECCRDNGLESSAVCRCRLTESLNQSIAMRSKSLRRPSIRILISGRKRGRESGAVLETVTRIRTYIFDNDPSKAMADEDEWYLLL